MGVDIQTYRCRIGSFYMRNSCKGTRSSDGGSECKTDVENGCNSTIIIMVVFCFITFQSEMLDMAHGVSHTALELLSELKEYLKLLLSNIGTLTNTVKDVNLEHSIYGELPNTHFVPDFNGSSRVIVFWDDGEWHSLSHGYFLEDHLELSELFSMWSCYEEDVISQKLEALALNSTTLLDTAPNVGDKVQHFWSRKGYNEVVVTNEGFETFFIGDTDESEYGYAWSERKPLSVIRTHLMISGVEPNPGPGCLPNVEVEAKANTFGDVFDSKKNKRSAVVRFGNVLPCTGSVKVGSFLGTQVFKMELNKDLRKRLLNKNNKEDKEFAISSILDELCNLCESVELETPPLFYLRKRNAYIVLPTASWWNEMKVISVNTFPTALLAYRNEFRHSYFCRDMHAIDLLDKHIFDGHVSCINFCDLKNTCGGFHAIACYRSSKYMCPNTGKLDNNPLFEPELKYPTQVSEDQVEETSEEAPSRDTNDSSLTRDDSVQPVHTDRLSNHSEQTLFFSSPRVNRTGVEINSNRSNTQRFQDMAPSLKRPQQMYPTAKYSSYEDVVSRRETYRGWPLPQPDPNTLCDAGFFFTGHSYDLVRCFCCGIGLKDFSDADNPLLEHVKHSANCPFMLNYFGSTEAMESYKQRHILQDPEQIRLRQRELYQQQQGRPIANYRAKHERFRALSSRLDTFANWPPHLSQRPAELSEAGMYYTGVDDHCRCFACDGGLRKWEPGDDPWIEHCRWFPACPYAREVKGDEFINLIQLSADHAAAENASNQHDEVNGAMAALTVDDRIIQQIINTNQPLLTRDMGFPVDDVRNAVLELVLQGTGEPNIDDIVTRLAVIAERKKVGEQFRIQESLSQSNAETLLKQNQLLKNLLLCHLCHNNQVNALFLPCTHHKYCLDCTQHRDRCPDCDRPIKEHIRTYMG